MKSKYTYPHIIGLYSPVPQSGKSTVAKMLGERNYARRAFAGPLKAMIRSLFLNLYSTSDIYMADDYKERQLPYFAETDKVTPRRLMQTLGTEWGRDLISQDLWVKAAMSHNSVDPEGRYVFDDMRFPNEFEAIKARGGVCWHISRPQNAKITTIHRSEGSLVDHKFDAYIDNRGTIDDLYAVVNDMLGDDENEG